MDKLTRSKTNRILSGICGGLGDYLKIDPTIIRIIYVFLALNSMGTAIIIYLIGSILIPAESYDYNQEDYQDYDSSNKSNTTLIIGGGLIVWGSFQLTRLLFPWLNLRFLRLWRLWPILLIALGFYIIYKERN